jgi:hypothetical protein
MVYLPPAFTEARPEVLAGHMIGMISACLSATVRRG